MPIADLAARGERRFGQCDRARMLPGAAAREREVVQHGDAHARVSDALGDPDRLLEMSGLPVRMPRMLWACAARGRRGRVPRSESASRARRVASACSAAPMDGEAPVRAHTSARRRTFCAAQRSPIVTFGFLPVATAMMDVRELVLDCGSCRPPTPPRPRPRSSTRLSRSRRAACKGRRRSRARCHRRG